MKVNKAEKLALEALSAKFKAINAENKRLKAELAEERAKTAKLQKLIQRNVIASAKYDTADKQIREIFSGRASA